MSDGVKVTFEERGWRFVWRPLDGGTVKIASVDDPEGNWVYQMDAPELVNLKRTDQFGMYPDRAFATVLSDFRMSARTWIADMEAGR